MQGKWKKLTTATVASAIIAAQAVMQVAAAGGTIDAEMSTKIPVLRVAVPTKMAVSVNEFQMGDAGSQVYSDEFTMKNLSEIPVNVKVTSTASLGAGVTLVGTRAEAEASTDATSPAMWLSAVAAVAKTGTTLEYTTESDKTVGALAGTEDNATAFTTGDSGSTAVQNFYLKQATAATYKGSIGNETSDIGSGADYYKLTLASPASDDDAGVAALAATKDIYIAKAGAIAANTPQELIKVEKGTAAADITANWTASTSKAYELETEPTDYATVKADSANSYLYIDTATAPTSGDVAAFRYAGALSSAKSGWSSTDDLKGIEIVYDITGISGPAYDDIAGSDGSGLTYGYKAGDAAEESPITLNSAGLMTITGFVLDDFESASITVSGETRSYAINSQAGKWDVTKDPVEYQFNETFVNLFKGKTVSIIINQKNDKPALEGTFTIAND